MTSLYMFSMINKYTFPNFHDFLQAAKKDDYYILVLMQIKEQKINLTNIIKNSGLDYDLSRFHFLAPEINDTYAPLETIDSLKKATGILVLGGNAHFYQKIYGNDAISYLVKERYQEGIPYAGISAGAILSLNYGLIENIAFKPHFSEKKRFNELLRKINKNKVKYGFGLDDNMSLKIQDEKIISCIGKDSFYLFSKIGDNDFNCKIFKNLDTPELNS